MPAACGQDNGKKAVYNGPAEVLRQVAFAPNCWKMTVRVPWTGPVQAGQFAHVLCDDQRTYPLLRRPLSVWDARDGDAGGMEIDLVYAVVGLGTGILAEKKPGDRVGWLGPLGRGYKVRTGKRTALLVAGGVGIVPLYLLSRQLREAGGADRRVLLFGARDASQLFGIDEFPALDVETRAATEDGSRGHHGLVTELMAETLKETGTQDVMVYSCGPEPMLEAVLGIVRDRGLPCEVSMEKRMGCAMGACGACVTAVRDGDGWRYSRICIEGPCYDAEQLAPGRWTS